MTSPLAELLAFGAVLLLLLGLNAVSAIAFGVAVAIEVMVNRPPPTNGSS